MTFKPGSVESGEPPVAFPLALEMEWSTTHVTTQSTHQERLGSLWGTCANKRDDCGCPGMHRGRLEFYSRDRLS